MTGFIRKVQDKRMSMTGVLADYLPTPSSRKSIDRGSIVQPDAHFYQDPVKQDRPPLGSARAKKDLRAPPRGYINRWSFPIIVGLASLLLSNRQETPVREPAMSRQR